jgi:hypothetical protein
MAHTLQNKQKLVNRVRRIRGQVEAATMIAHPAGARQRPTAGGVPAARATDSRCVPVS